MAMLRLSKHKSFLTSVINFAKFLSFPSDWVYMVVSKF